MTRAAAERILLDVEVEKRFSGGATIAGAWQQQVGTFSVVVLFGPSGCGKTTLLRCLAGLERPERGRIRFGEHVWFDAATRVHVAPQQRGISYLFQDYALFPHLTVEDNVSYGLYRLPRAERKTRTDQTLEAFQIGELRERYPDQISGGQQQRVALARSLAIRPRLLLLDEPLSALDAPTREALRRELRQLLERFEIPAVVVTHDWLEASALADHVVVLDEGRIRQQGPLHEVFSRPKNEHVARIVGVETVAPGRVLRVEEGLATVTVGQAELVAMAGVATAGEEVYVCIRAEEVVLLKEAPEATSARNCLPGRILKLTPEGPVIRAEVEAGFRLAAVVTHPAVRELGLAEGQPVVALVKAPAVHLVRRR